MSRTDIIADAFTIIRNAARAKQTETLTPYSNILVKICEIIKREGYIDNFKEVDLGRLKKIKVYLKYEGKKSALKEIKKVSTPGRRIYLKSKDVPSVLHGYGTGLISASCGILTDKEAREKGTGGEFVGEIW